MCTGDDTSQGTWRSISPGSVRAGAGPRPFASAARFARWSFVQTRCFRISYASWLLISIRSKERHNRSNEEHGTQTHQSRCANRFKFGLPSPRRHTDLLTAWSGRSGQLRRNKISLSPCPLSIDLRDKHNAKSNQGTARRCGGGEGAQHLPEAAPSRTKPNAKSTLRG